MKTIRGHISLFVENLYKALARLSEQEIRHMYDFDADELCSYRAEGIQALGSMAYVPGTR